MPKWVCNGLRHPSVPESQMIQWCSALGKVICLLVPGSWGGDLLFLLTFCRAKQWKCDVIVLAWAVVNLSLICTLRILTAWYLRRIAKWSAKRCEISHLTAKSLTLLVDYLMYVPLIVFKRLIFKKLLRPNQLPFLSLLSFRNQLWTHVKDL